MRQLFSKVISSPVGDLRAVVSEAGLVALLWQAGHPQRVRMGEVCAHGAHPVLLETERQLREYFAGDRRTFSLPLDASGTPFQRQVWQALALIPYGETRSYGELARQLGNPQLTRAVGSANGRNPSASWCRAIG